MNTLILHTRRRLQADVQQADASYLEETMDCNPASTAIIICDMWNDHWCGAAARRVDEMAPTMNQVVQRARSLGMFIIHSPSDTLGFYSGSAARRRAQEAGADQRHSVNPPERIEVPEPPLPIDDSDGGCDSGEPPWHTAWSRQHPAIAIEDQDAISDSASEIDALLVKRQIELVILMGVHTNMCILNRPFGIRRMVGMGRRVFLVRDMTDTMYNPEKHPFVSHFRGTELVIEHIERYLCPTITSTDFTNQPAFRFYGA